MFWQMAWPAKDAIGKKEIDGFPSFLKLLHGLPVDTLPGNLFRSGVRDLIWSVVLCAYAQLGISLRTAKTVKMLLKRSEGRAASF